jgi:hypothetical protein
MATNDVNLTTRDLMRDYGCAVGLSLSPENAPLTAPLMQRASAVTIGNTNIAKLFYRRQRPYFADAARRVSQGRSSAPAMTIRLGMRRSAGLGRCCSRGWFPIVLATFWHAAVILPKAESCAACTT